MKDSKRLRIAVRLTLRGAVRLKIAVRLTLHYVSLTLRDTHVFNVFCPVLLYLPLSCSFLLFFSL